MSKQNNTDYASDVYMIEDDKSGYRRNTSPVLINKPTRPVKPPVTPPVTPPVSGGVNDFAFMTVPHLHGDRLNLVVNVNGVILSDIQYSDYREWLDSNSGTIEFAGSAYNASMWLQWALGNIGIAMYDSYDTFGCWTLFKFQNLTNAPKTITIEVTDDFGVDGISVVPGSLLGKPNNPTIDLSRPSSSEGYNKVVLTLDPCTRPELVDVTPEQIKLASPKQDSQRLVTTYQDGYYGAAYKFKVNGVQLRSEMFEGDTFVFNTQEQLEDAYDSLLAAGVSLNSIIHNDGTRDYLRCNFTPVELDTPYLLEITQDMQHSEGAGSQDETVYDVIGVYPIKRVVNETATGVQVTVSTYIYDPISLVDYGV